MIQPRPAAVFLLSLVLLALCAQAFAHNPFTTRPEKHHVAPAPPVKAKFFVRIITWQQQLRLKMSALIRETKEKRSLAPVLMLLVFAFTYGMVHSAGPGHGKAVAMTYIVAFKPGLIRGLLFGNLLALTHGLSGIFFVLIVKFILQTGMSRSLEMMTDLTQRISFSLITALGVFICIKGIVKWTRPKNEEEAPPVKGVTNPYITAVAIGIIPCPGVVMVMLFAISMGVTWLGVLLGITIALGMASTITLIVFAAMTGKAAMLQSVSRRKNVLKYLEHTIEITAGIGVAGLGILFLLTSV
ncbi:MAG: hypothetical protein D3926_15055 [Desulfobacteraceae bacterium]|nr:MAG: hypothetical protein D3926_15055 [Desulfobacteraceae bacterium]